MIRLVAAAMTAALLLALRAAPAIAHGDGPAAPELPGVLLAWRLDLLPLAGVLTGAGLYLWAVRRVRRRHPQHPHPWSRTAFFLGGLATILVALVSPIEAYEGALFSVHMVQHMLLQLVAAPLLLLGAPVTLALRAASPSVRRSLLVILHSRAMMAISFPLVAWVLFAAVNWGWHFSSLYDQALDSGPLHYLQHASFMAVALLFWWPVIGLDPSRWRLPYPARLFYLFLAMPQNSFLGVSLMGSPRVLYQHYATNLRDWGPTPIADQGIGGALMWVMGDMIFLIAMGAVVVAWVRHEDRRTEREDARLDALEAVRRSAAEAARPQPPP